MAGPRPARDQRDAFTVEQPEKLGSADGGQRGLDPVDSANRRQIVIVNRREHDAQAHVAGTGFRCFYLAGSNDLGGFAESIELQCQHSLFIFEAFETAFHRTSYGSRP